VVNAISLRWFTPLMGQYRIYAPDTIGHPGKSAQVRLSTKDLSYGQWAVDLLDGLGLDRPTFIGPSFGGGITLQTAAYAPDRIGKAILLMPSSVGSGSIWRMIAEILVPMLLYRLSPTPERLLKAAQPMFTGVPNPDALEVTGAVYRHLKLEAEMPRMITAEDLKGYTAPTLLVAAERDIFFPAHVIVPRLKAAIPHLQTAVIPGGSHYPSAEGEAFIIDQIRSFLQ
jgi:pimeloyl-ACP methyl ester carboxylesterase